MRPWNLDLLTSPKVVPNKIKKMSGKQKVSKKLFKCALKKRKTVSHKTLQRSLSSVPRKQKWQKKMLQNLSHPFSSSLIPSFMISSPHMRTLRITKNRG
jgi:flagellar hook-length control protein FliK